MLCHSVLMSLTGAVCSFYPSSHLNIPVEEHYMFAAPGAAAVVLCLGPEQQQVVGAARVTTGHRGQPLQLLKRALRASIPAGWCLKTPTLRALRSCQRGHSFGYRYESQPHRNYTDR